jgi:hypothetical protein
MTQLLADYAATGLPPAYLPVSELGVCTGVSSGVVVDAQEASA